MVLREASLQEIHPSRNKTGTRGSGRLGLCIRTIIQRTLTYPLADATQAKTADWGIYASTEASGALDRSVRLCKPLGVALEARQHTDM